MDWYILISDSVHICQALRCAVPYINVPSINQFHLKTSELLSENKTLTKTLT